MRYVIQVVSKFTVVFLLCNILNISSISAQGLMKFGHVDSNELLKSMPEFESALSKLEDLKTAQNEKLTMMQQEFEKQMEAYMKGQATLAKEVAVQNEKELQQMRSNMEAYYQQGSQELQKKEAELTQPVIVKAKEAIEAVGKEHGFIYIFDISKGAFVFNSVESEDVLPLVKKKLGIAE